VYVDKSYLLQLLPPYRDEWVTVTTQQDVGDIIEELIKAHKDFEPLYDKIGTCFISGSVDEICDTLNDFTFENIRYKEESENSQRIITPQGILTRGYGDCKHFASFIGGCLGAIERATGWKIDWHYCFASYKYDERTPYHVFVVVNGPNGETFIDPTPGARGKIPLWTVDKYINSSLTKKLTGISVNAAGEMEAIGSYQANLQTTGKALPVPGWYPSNLPRFYMQDDGHTVLLRPQNAVPKYTDSDILDCMVLLQMLMGDGRNDGDNSYNICWQDFPGSNVYERIKYVFLNDPTHDNDWDFAQFPTRSVNNGLAARLRERIVLRLSADYPYLTGIAARYGGLINQSIPYPGAKEVQRPAWYANNLPSLFYKNNGYLTTFFKVSNYKPDAKEVSDFLVYAFPVVAAGKAPYNINWFLNEDFNGAKYAAYFIGDVENGGNNFFGNDFLAAGEQLNYMGFSRWQDYSIFPDFAIPHKTTLLDTISQAAVAIVKKIPVISTAWVAVNSIATAMNAGDLPKGTFSADVAADAKALAATVEQQKASATTNKYILLAVAGLLVVGYYYRKDIEKYFS
jgi:hypothetical protein